MGYAKKKTQEKPNGGLANQQDIKLCFWLGFFFLILGVLIAAIIAKTEGVRSALKGFMWSFFFGTVIFLVRFWVSQL